MGTLEQNYVSAGNNTGGGKDASITELEIIFDEAANSMKYNKELINYFKNNLDKLNRSGVRFVWRIATKDEYSLYKERGIKHYPAIIVPPKIMKYGVNDIIKEITSYIGRRKQMMGSLATINDGMAMVSDEALHEYQRRAIGQASDDNEEQGDNFDANYRRRQSEMLKRRKMAGMEDPMQSTRQDGSSGDIDMGMNDDMGLGGNYQVRIPGEGGRGGRPDNVNPMRLDPSDSLAKLRRSGSGIDSGDMDMMQAQLEKMGGSGDLSGMDYY